MVASVVDFNYQYLHGLRLQLIKPNDKLQEVSDQVRFKRLTERQLPKKNIINQHKENVLHLRHRYLRARVSQLSRGPMCSAARHTS